MFVNTHGTTEKFYRDETVYNKADDAAGFNKIFQNPRLSGFSTFDDAACGLIVNDDGDRFVLDVPSGGWQLYLRLIVPAGSGQFGYTRDGTE